MLIFYKYVKIILNDTLCVLNVDVVALIVEV